MVHEALPDLQAADGSGPRSWRSRVDGRNISDGRGLSRHRRARLGGRPRRQDHGARADDRPPGAQGDRRAARLPGGRRPRLPDPRPRERQPVGRRGAADPARDPDRDDADGRPVHPRRALDRPPPARQREADRDADPPARPRQHGPRRRARRGDDPHGRLGRSTSGPGRGSTAARSSPTARSRPCSPSRARSPARSCAATARCAVPDTRRRGNGKRLSVRGRARAQPRDIDVRLPARDVHRRDRRLRLAARARSWTRSCTAPWRAT